MPVSRSPSSNSIASENNILSMVMPMPDSLAMGFTGIDLIFLDIFFAIKCKHNHPFCRIYTSQLLQ